MSKEELFYIDQAQDAAATDTASVDDTIPEVWSNRVLHFMKSNLVLGNLPGVQDRTLVGTAGDILHLPVFDQVTAVAAAVAENADATVVELTTTEVTATPSEVAKAVQLTEKMMSRSIVNMMEEATRRLGYGLALKMEQDIRVELEATVNAGANSGQLLDKTGQQFSEDFLADAKRIFRKNAPDAELGGLVAVLHPDHTVVLEKSSKFVDASVYGGREVLLNGEFGRYLGVRLLMSDIGRQGAADFDSDSTNDQDCWVLGPDAFRVAIKRDPYIRTQYQALGRYWDVVATMEYAVTDYRAKHIVRIVADVAP
jgi:N4-gp56 family major capsid protein